MKIEYVLKIVIRSKNLEIYEYETKNFELYFHFFYNVFDPSENGQLTDCQQYVFQFTS